MSKEAKTKPDKVFNGRSIQSIWPKMAWNGHGVDHYEVLMSDGSKCIIDLIDIYAALKQCSFNAFMAKKYYHLQTRPKTKIKKKKRT